jgi:hypothetical protein
MGFMNPSGRYSSFGVDGTLTPAKTSDAPRTTFVWLEDAADIHDMDIVSSHPGSTIADVAALLGWDRSQPALVDHNGAGG